MHTVCAADDRRRDQPNAIEPIVIGFTLHSGSCDVEDRASEARGCHLNDHVDYGRAWVNTVPYGQAEHYSRVGVLTDTGVGTDRGVGMVVLVRL